MIWFLAGCSIATLVLGVLVAIAAVLVTDRLESLW